MRVTGMRVVAAALAALCGIATSACILPSYEEAPPSPPTSSLLPLWSRRLGGVMDDHALGVATDAAGNVILAGRFESRMSFDGDMNFVGPAMSGDGFVAKYDDAGRSLFSLTFGDDVMAQEASSVTVDPSNQDVIFGGSFSGTAAIGEAAPLVAGLAGAALVARLNAGGDVLWTRAFTDQGNYWYVGSRGVAVDGMGDVLLAGQWCGQVDFSAGDAIPGVGIITDPNTNNGFVTKREAQTGDLEWVVRFDAEGIVVATAVAVDASDNVLVTGFYEGNGSITDTEGMTIPIGPTAVGRDLFVAELDSEGRYLWSVGIDEEGTQMGTAIAVDPGGNALMTGLSALGVEGEIAPAGFHAIALKIDLVGSVLWKVGIPGLDLDAGHAVAADANGDVLVAGRRRPLVRPPLEKRDDVLVALLDGEDGTVKTTATYGGDGAQYGAGLALDGEGNVIVAGGFEEELDFGAGALMSKGESDIFVAKLRHP